jgi:hypothetical protein
MVYSQLFGVAKSFCMTILGVAATKSLEHENWRIHVHLNCFLEYKTYDICVKEHAGPYDWQEIWAWQVDNTARARGEEEQWGMR